MTRLRAWCGLLGGASAAAVFMFAVAPWMERWEPVRTLHAFMEERGIEATPLFYTESDEFESAERYVRDAVRFAPRKP